jgi:hypothetical protein
MSDSPLTETLVFELQVPIGTKTMICDHEMFTINNITIDRQPEKYSDDDKSSHVISNHFIGVAGYVSYPVKKDIFK